MAAKSEISDPPVLGDDTNYESWSKDLEIWNRYTNTAAAKKGLRLYLSLKGKPRSIVRNLPADTIDAEDGYQQILKKLDAYYKKNAVQRAFVDLEAFERFQRSPGMPINDYIVQFEQLYCKIEEHKIEYPTGVSAYKLIQLANLDETRKDLIKATMKKLDYDEVKQKMLTIFDNISSTSTLKSEPTVKIEKTYYEENPAVNESYYVNPRSFRGRGYRGRYNIRRGQNNYRQNSNRGRGFTENNGRNRGFPENNVRRGSNRKLNPVDSTGEVSKCAICQSIYHWARECPDAHENQHYKTNNTYQLEEKVTEDYAKLTMFCHEIRSSGIILYKTDESEETVELNSLLAETFSAAILDTGAPDTVCGRKWMQEYTETLTDKEKSSITRSTSERQYRFGNNEPIKATEHIKVPMTIASEKVFVDVDIVDADIPLLLSKNSLQKAKATMDLGNNVLHIFGKSIKLLESKSGHYILPVTHHPDSGNEESNILYATEIPDIKKQALKLHRHFSHPRKERLQKLLQDAGKWNKEFNEALTDIEKECKTCKIYSKPPTKPVVGFSYAHAFNDVIALDLKDFKHDGKTYKLLHIIDLCTRFSQAVQVKSKCREEIIKALFDKWITIFGPPNKVLSDNGGEFVNSDFIEVCDKYNITVKTTAAESPWGNGVVERHHKVLCSTLQKTLEEIKVFNIALCWAVQAKNTLFNIHGFSPYILVFGKNPELPNVFRCTPPSLENITPSEYLANHINAMNMSRQAYLKCESEEKIKRALKRNVSSSVDQKYVTGDRVYIKRRDNDRWSGPGTVLGQDYQQVLVKIGGLYYRVHPCRMILVEESKKALNRNLDEQTSHNIEDKEDINDSWEIPEAGDENEINENNDITENAPNLLNENNENLLNIEADHIEEVQHEIQPDIVINNDDQNLIRKIEIPKRKLHIEYEVEGETHRGTVMNKQPKQKGVHKNWVNIRKDNQEELCVNFENVVNWKVIDEEEQTEEIFICAKREKGEIMYAKQKELENWKMNNVFTEVKDLGQNRVNVKWVVEEKVKNGSLKIKARLVAKGYQDLDQTRNDSPTCTRESIRLILIIAATMGWTCKSIDIRAAFLQGDPLDREVYLEPPKEFKKEGMIWQLNQCVYGLNEASRRWYSKVRHEMEELGASIPKVDPALFVWKRDGVLLGILSSHVDDFLFCGNVWFENSVINKLKNTFEISNEEENVFCYLGLNLSHDKEGYYMDQINYVHNLKPIEIEECRKFSKDAAVTESELKQIRSRIGQLNWLSGQTRPDLSFETSRCASNINEAKVNHIQEINKVIKKAKSEEVTMKIPKLNDLNNVRIVVHSDAALGNVSDFGSQGAFVIFLVDSKGKSALISWNSRKIKRVARSTLTSETLALCDGVDKAMYINSLISDILFDGERKLAVDCYTDSRSLTDAVKTSNTLEEKRLLIDLASLREAINRNEISVTWIESKSNLANPLTKRTASSRCLLDVVQKGNMNA